MKKKKRILIFGTFDGIHDGHIFFLNQAKKLGDLYISVASNKSIKERKLKIPLYPESKRLTDLLSLNLTRNISIGDDKLHTWTNIKEIKPDIIALGYDQTDLEKELIKIQKDLGFKIKKIKSKKPKILHSSILNKPCAFCTVPEIKARTIIENKKAFAFPTNIPIVPGHILISPKRCVRTFEEMTGSEIKAIFSLMAKLKIALKNTFGAEGFNIAWNEGKLAGQSVPHFYLHLLPRKEGDTGITKYEPRKFLYRPGSRKTTPGKELVKIASILRKNIK